jgi:hypothetical protein
MKLVFAVFVSAVLLAAAEPQEKKTAAPAKLIKPLEVPPGAVEREPGRFYYTDAQGKKWIYSKTPFGTAKLEDKPADPDAPKPIDPLANVKITEEGDTVKFERPGPFGVYKWQKKLTDLDDKEKAALTKFHESSPKQKPESKQE